MLSRKACQKAQPTHLDAYGRADNRWIQVQLKSGKNT